MDHSEVQRGKFYRAVVDGRETDVLVEQKLVDDNPLWAIYGGNVIYELLILPTGRTLVARNEVQFLYERVPLAPDGEPAMTEDEFDEAMAGLENLGLVDINDPSNN